jgi:hypothetical protein
MRMLISIVLLIFFGSISSYLAKQRGRDPVGWFMIGMLLGILAPLLLLLLPNLTEQEDKPLQDIEENEDQKLARLEPTPPPPEENYNLKEWFFLNDQGVQNGPMGFHMLKQAWKEGVLFGHSYVWSEGMSGWKRIEEMPDFEEQLDS